MVTSAESERSCGFTPVTAWLAAGPNRPSAIAEMSLFDNTSRAAISSPLARRTPAARPPLTRISATCAL
ncbi:MAG: hypothetical protein MUE77_09420 [Sandarakinorhabdus sp.]|nr:hypothetical protein [Sandarakinorhabdus sp.]